MLAKGVPRGPLGGVLGFQKGLGSPEAQSPGLPACEPGGPPSLCRPWMLFLRKAASRVWAACYMQAGSGGAGWIQVRLPGLGQLMGWGEPGERSVSSGAQSPEGASSFRSGRRSCRSQAWEDMNCGLWCRRVRQASRAGGALKAGGHLPGMARRAGGWPAVPHDSGLSWFRTGFHSAREPSAWCPHYMDGSLRAPLPHSRKRPGLRGEAGLWRSRLCPQRAVGEAPAAKGRREPPRPHRTAGPGISLVRGSPSSPPPISGDFPRIYSRGRLCPGDKALRPQPGHEQRFHQPGR